MPLCDPGSCLQFPPEINVFLCQVIFYLAVGAQACPQARVWSVCVCVCVFVCVWAWRRDTAGVQLRPCWWQSVFTLSKGCKHTSSSIHALACTNGSDRILKSFSPRDCRAWGRTRGKGSHANSSMENRDLNLRQPRPLSPFSCIRSHSLTVMVVIRYLVTRYFNLMAFFCNQ